MKIDIVTAERPQAHGILYPFTRSFHLINEPVVGLMRKWRDEAAKLLEEAGPITQRRGPRKVVVGFKNEAAHRKWVYVSTMLSRLSEGSL